MKSLLILLFDGTDRASEIERVMAEYMKIETELRKHREEGRKEMEEFLVKKAEETHNEIVRQLRINDEKMNHYHQVSPYDNSALIISKLLYN